MLSASNTASPPRMADTPLPAEPKDESRTVARTAHFVLPPRMLELAARPHVVAHDGPPAAPDAIGVQQRAFDPASFVQDLDGTFAVRRPQHALGAGAGRRVGHGRPP